MKAFLVLAGASVLSLTACFHVDAADPEAMMRLSTHVKTIAEKAEGVQYLGGFPAGASAEDKARVAVKDEPSLLDHFKDYRLQLFENGHHAIVLVCTKDGAFALIEDGGCTEGVDRHHWKTTPRPACAPTFDYASCP